MTILVLWYMCLQQKMKLNCFDFLIHHDDILNTSSSTKNTQEGHMTYVVISFISQPQCSYKMCSYKKSVFTPSSPHPSKTPPLQKSADSCSERRARTRKPGKINDGVASSEQ